jgi:hypothetical protein
MYLVWEGVEVATKESRRNWKCFCGYKEAHEYRIHLHLEIEHKIIGAVLRQDNENYDGTII